MFLRGWGWGGIWQYCNEPFGDKHISCSSFFFCSSIPFVISRENEYFVITAHSVTNTKKFQTKHMYFYLHSQNFKLRNGVFIYDFEVAFCSTSRGGYRGWGTVPSYSFVKKKFDVYFSKELTWASGLGNYINI